ncbi:MAG: type II secretion system protein [Desulfuromonadales bacterium]|nr:type II secretion system protein [Desulfuromonadales bacterium]NIS42237.1 type II secretion system protein [Desulfuromonadales bacterium]
MRKAGFRHLDDERGAALLIVLLMVVVLGLAIGIAGSTWKSLTQRAREAELFWRGDQYRKAIGSYYRVKHGRAVGMFPRKLENLLQDPRSLGAERHIRRLYPDPMTGGEWQLIKDKSGRITGVKSSSTLEPFRQDGFPEEYEKFEGAESYSSWEFVYKPKKKKKAPAKKVKAGGKKT